MSWLDYISIGLVVMSMDATFCHVIRKEYQPLASFVLSMLWPLTCIIIIIAVCMIQKQNGVK